MLASEHKSRSDTILNVELRKSATTISAGETLRGSAGPWCISWKVLINLIADTHISKNDINDKTIDGKMIKKSILY